MSHIRRYFDRDSITREQRFQEDTILRYEQLVRQEAISSLINNKYQLALDVGCGNGRDFGMLLRCADKLIGIDFSQGMIKETKYTANRLQSESKTTLIMGDVTNLPFRANSVGFILCSEVLEHVPDWSRAPLEFYRVLNGNGELIVTTPNKISMYGITRYAGRLLFGSKHPYDVWKSYFEIRDALKTAGFEIIGVKGACYLPGDISYYQPFKKMVVFSLKLFKLLETTFLSSLSPFKLLGYMVVIKARKPHLSFEN